MKRLQILTLFIVAITGHDLFAPGDEYEPEDVVTPEPQVINEYRPAEGSENLQRSTINVENIAQRAPEPTVIAQPGEGAEHPTTIARRTVGGESTIPARGGSETIPTRETQGTEIPQRGSSRESADKGSEGIAADLRASIGREKQLRTDINSSQAEYERLTEKSNYKYLTDKEQAVVTAHERNVRALDQELKNRSTNAAEYKINRENYESKEAKTQKQTAKTAPRTGQAPQQSSAEPATPSAGVRTPFGGKGTMVEQQHPGYAAQERPGYEPPLKENPLQRLSGETRTRLLAEQNEHIHGQQNRQLQHASKPGPQPSGMKNNNSIKQTRLF